jgi:hypothetical protein
MSRKRKVRAATRHARAKREGIAALGGYEAVLAEQGGGCAICGRRAKAGGRRLNIDHDHVTGAVRGVLCASCNRGIGWFRDVPVCLETAAVYLKWGMGAAVTYRDAAMRNAT